MQAMHGRLSDPITYQALQHFITHSPWPVVPLWDRLRSLVPVRTGFLAIDDTGLPKQGTHSVGVKRQYCGAKGKVANCQVAVSSVLLSGDLRWPLAFELYVPQDWFSDPDRCAEVGLPASLRFREKWRIALAQVRQVLKAGFQFTAVLADADYGANAAFRRGLERLGLRYGVAIRGDLRMWTTTGRQTQPAKVIAAHLAEDAWHHVVWATGTKGPPAARFAAVRVRPAKSLAEVDYFEVLVEVDGTRRKAWLFLMGLMYSGRDFAWIYERQDDQAWIEQKNGAVVRTLRGVPGLTLSGLTPNPTRHRQRVQEQRPGDARRAET
jgi:hypothetical protein